MILLPIKYILLLTLVLPIKGFNTGVGKVAGQNKRQVKLYSGTRPTPIVCNGEGFQADPVDCSVFHRCMRSGKGRYVSFRCGPGTIYDPDIEICNHPERTKRTSCGGIIKELPKSTNDNEINQEIPTPISTKEPVYVERKPDDIFSTLKPFTPITELYGTAAIIISSSSTRALSTANQMTNPERQPVKMLGFTTPKAISFNNRQSTSQPGDFCISEGFMGDSENCRKFYRCIGNQRGGFIRYEFQCSDPTIWDDEKQACNHVWAVKRSRCGRGHILENEIKSHDGIKAETLTNRMSEPDRDSSVSSQIQSQINYGSKVTQTQTQISNGTVQQNQTQVNYDKGHDVKQNQTQISYGTAVSQSQSQINFGDKGMQTQLQIDHLNDSSQIQSQLVEPTSTTNNTPTSTNNGPQDKTSTTTTQTPNNECTESGFVGDSNDCKKFYRCVDNGRGSFTRYEFSCGEGTVWDSSLESCNHAWAVKECGGKGSSGTSSQGSIDTTQSHTTVSQTPTTSKSTSSSYYPPEQAITEDDNDIPYGNAPTSSTTSKPIQSMTTTSTESQPLDDNKCKSSGFMGDNKDCKKFYRCVDNGNGQYTRYEFSCGDGTVWDSKIEACNHVWAVEKCGGTQNNDNNKEESTTTKATQSTSPPLQSTSQIIQQNEDFDTGYGLQQDESSTVIAFTTITTTEITSTTTTTTETSQNPDLDNKNECKESGFMGDNKDCKKFYRCVDNGKGTYTKYEFSCGEGTVWDQKIQSCNHAWAVEKCGSATSTDAIVTTTQEFENTTSFTTTTTTTQNLFTDEENDGGYVQQSNVTPTSSATTESGNQNNDNNICTSSGFMGDNNNCKKFYRCVDNGNGGYTKYEFDCGDGTVWDQSIESCNHEWAVSDCLQSGYSNSTNNVESTIHHSSTTSTTESEDQGYNQQSSEESTTSTSSTSIPSNNKCLQEGFYGDENNCKNFYRCVDNSQGGYTKYEFTCGEGTIWNQEISACDHESANKPCKSNVPTTSTRNPNSENDEMVTEATPQSTSESSTKPEQSPSSVMECQEEGFYGDSNNCKKFYRCVRNEQGGFIKYEFSCGEGTIWVQEIQACDHDNGVTSCTYEDNTLKPTSEPVQSTTLSSQNISQTQDTDKESGEQSYETSAKPPSSANDTCDSEGFYANENDCTKFYRCVDNGQGGYTKYDFTCGEGTAWDPNVQTCNHIAEVSSCKSNQEQSQPEHDEEASVTTESTSTTKGSSSSNDSSSNEDNCQQEGYFGNTKDCKKFYRCVDNGKGGYTKYDFDCGEGTIWDQDITTCNHPQDVTNPSCKNKDGEPSSTESTSMGSSTSSSSTTSGTMSQATQSNSDNSSQNTSCSQENSSDKPGQQKYKCEKAGYYADPDDCKKFYRCVDWDGNGQRFSIYHFDCGEGTIWDPALDTCNHEDSVYPPRDCSGTQSQGESITQETTTTTEKTTTDESTSSSTEKTKTTQKSTTSDQTTEQQSTTTTTQELTTSEQTTTESATTESTSQQSNVEQTTTEQTSTTSQQTTQTATTSEQTTQQPSSSEQTTQAATTSEQTTQQPSSSEQTTQAATTSEQTTQLSNSSEQTTQQTSSSEQTTTQQTTTSEETTQPATTSEQTTSLSTTSEPTTSQQMTTEQTTTEQSTDSGDTTTQSSTTEQQTTTTEQTTSITEQPDQTTTENETTTTEGTTTTTTETDSTSTTEAIASDKECPETEDDQYLYVCPTSFRRHPKYCNMFYQCTEDDDSHEVKIATFTCPNNTIYDESKTQCVEENKADKKCNGQIARKHRVKRLNSYSKEPIEVGQSKYTCAAIGYFQFEKENECSSVFLKCLPSKSGKLRGFVYQCPEGYVYWSISKRCEKRERMKYCQESNSQNWKSRWEIPVERRNLAK